MVKPSILFCSFCLFVSSVWAQQEKPPSPFTFKSGQSVYVVTVRHDTPMPRETWLEMVQNARLPGARMVSPSSAAASGSNGRATLERNPSERTTLERAPLERPTLDRETQPMLLFNRPADEPLSKSFAEVLRKQKKFKWVETVEQADFVLLVQAEYVAGFSQLSGDRGGIAVFNGHPDSGNSTQGNLLVKIKAFAIPAKIFSSSAGGRLPDNAETVHWRGHVVGELRGGLVPPTPESLIKKFQQETLK